ncbi:MAG: MFS transporter, partial [Rhodospirillales bacterium]|nr:MFS transporter [Rhodospirillales bacterium]
TLMTSMTTPPSFFPALRILLPFALGYYLSYVFRTINAVIASDLVADIGFSAAGLGLMTSAYFLSFAACQLPLGVILDRIGPRKTEAALLLLAAAGSFWFAMAETETGLICARALIGIGVSACLMASFKAFVDWFPREKHPVMNGLILMAGGLGAMSSTAPIEAALQVTDWRGVFLGLAVVGLAASAVIFYVVPERPADLKLSSEESLSDQIKDMGDILRTPMFYRHIPLVVVSQGSFLAALTLWAGPWFRDVAGLERGPVATSLLIVATVMTAGYLMTGGTASRLNRRGFKTESIVLTGMLFFMAIQVPIILGFRTGAIYIWSLFAFFGTSGSVMFSALSQNFPGHLMGRVSTMMNLLVFLLAFTLQWAMGVIINLYPTSSAGGFDPQGYQAAFLFLFVLQGLGGIWYWGSGHRKLGGTVPQQPAPL